MMSVSNCEVLQKGNSNNVKELKKQLQRLMMEIVDEDDEHEEEGKNERQIESENRVILGTIKRNRMRDEIEPWKSGLKNNFSYFFKGK